jgi:thiol-disulfide isomerase/thioredoxin
VHLNNYLNSKFLQLTAICALFTLLLNAHAAWDVQPKLGYKLTPLPKPVPAPPFTLEDMDEEKHSLDDLRGKVVLLNFWATWCPPCRREMPSMERLYQKLSGENFTVIAINQMEDADHVFAYTGQLDVDPTFTVLFDTDSKVSNSFNVKGLPTTYLIDKQGNIRYRAIGGREFDHPEVEKQIMQLMQE